MATQLDHGFTRKTCALRKNQTEPIIPCHKFPKVSMTILKFITNKRCNSSGYFNTL